MPEIILPPSNQPDIYSLGFDVGLNRNTYNSPKSPMVYNAVGDQQQTGSIASGGNIQASSLQSYDFSKYISPGDDIQAAINTVFNAGGGKVYLKNGTYVPTSPIIGRSGVDLIGEKMSSTIIDFKGSLANITYEGLNVYTTGSVVSITGGTTVNGSGITAWTTSMIGQQMFLNNRWYVISDVTSTATIKLATGYADGATFSGAYRISSVLKDIRYANLTIQNSKSTALKATDIRDVLLEDVSFPSNNVGFSFTNFMNCEENRVLISSSTSDGYQLTNGSFHDAYGLAAVSNGGNGATLNNIKTCGWELSACDSNTGDGFNLTTVTNCEFVIEMSSNTGKGMQMVSGCSGNVVHSSLNNSNTSDGIKLTASANNNTIGSGIDITNNGGFGINIANANCNNNIIVNPYYTGNTSGNLSDSGTGTTVVSNPMTTGGDVTYGGTNGLPTRLANGSSGQFLMSNGTTLAPSWSTLKSSNGTVILSATGTTTVTVNFKAISVKIYAVSNATVIAASWGGWDTTTNNNNCTFLWNAAAGITGDQSANAYFCQDSATTRHSGTVGNITTTTFDIVNTKTGASANTVLFWSAVGS